MKARLSREEEFKEVNIVTIHCGGNEFRIQEDNEGKLVITKASLGTLIDSISVNPSSSNEVKLF